MENLILCAVKSRAFYRLILPAALYKFSNEIYLYFNRS